MSARIVFLDAYSGASGDMLLGALLDAGLDLRDLQNALRGLDATGYSISPERVMRGALGATLVHVSVEQPQPERRLGDIAAMIGTSALPERVREQALSVFQVLAQAEGRVHRVPPDDVHFHELGALDAIVDIVGVCLGLELLGVEHVYASPLPLATGTILTAHGEIPLPGPAVLEILAQKGAPTIPPPTPVRQELVTPTGAALLCALASFVQPVMTLEAVGHGAGTAELAHPNILRLWLGRRPPDGDAAHGDGVVEERLVMLETNIDDMNPQVYGYLFHRLLEAGALDVFCTATVMKKNRPGTMLSVLCTDETAPALQYLIFSETTTLGIRRHDHIRVSLHRAETEVATPLGPLRVKIKLLGGRVVAAIPEYDDCLALARRHGRSLLQIQEMARQAAVDLLQSEPVDQPGGMP